MKTLKECEALLERVGLATVLPAKDGLLPCLLWEARGNRGPFEDWDEAMERVWTWKDELPARRTAWFGRLFGDRVILLHRRLLPPFLRWRGQLRVQDIYDEGHLTQEAFRVWNSVERADEPVGRIPLRRAAGLSAREDAARFDRACRDLERRLLLTRAGRSPLGQGWDSNAYAPVESWFSEEWKAAADWSWGEAKTAVREALEAAAPEASSKQLDRWMRQI